MLPQEKREITLFLHKVISILNFVGSIYALAETKNGGILGDEQKDEIRGCKFDFRTYLKPYALGWKEFPYMSNIYNESKIKDSYEKSDFDWNDYTKFKPFVEWFVEPQD
jgi:hypothetical protein